MKRTLARWLWSIAWLVPATASAASEPASTHHLQSRLVAETTAAVPGEPLAIGLLLVHDPHWHTYWRHPGDSGLATRIEFVLPDGVVAAPIAWPYPQRFELAGIANFGYDGRRLLPVTLSIPSGYAAPTLPVRATAHWLVCEAGGECIPGQAGYTFELPVASEAAPDERWASDFAATRADLPRAAAATLAIVEDGADLVLTLADGAAMPAQWQWLPETPGLVANAEGPTWRRGDAGWEARWPKNAYFAALPADAAFVAVDEAAAPGDTRAWRFVAVAATPGGAGSATAAPGAAAEPPGAGTGGGERSPRWPPWLSVLAAAGGAAAIAIVMRASRPRRNDPTRSEETSR